MWRVIRGDRISVSEAARRDQVRIDPLGNEEVRDGLRPFQRKLLVAVNPLLPQFGADWKKWSRAERMLAAMVTLLMVALPLGLLMTG